jgi:hypothetical protein
MSIVYAMILNYFRLQKNKNLFLEFSGVEKLFFFKNILLKKIKKLQKNLIIFRNMSTS